ncbi:UvrD-helicase domain-containing protein [Nocardioides dilutus]
MASHNEFVMAAAGSGKTKLLLDEALVDRSRRVLITTYTRENLREIRTRLWEEARAEHRITTMSWFEFLLREGVKPYQAYKTDILSIRSINFHVRRSGVPALRYAKKDDFRQYYTDKGLDLYQDVVSDLVCALDQASGGKVVRRLASCYDAIFIDELQDLAGPDLDLLIRLMDSDLRVLGVGDPRQSVYVTNTANRNRQHRRAAIMGWIERQVHDGRLTTRALTESYRCNQLICDFADGLYPEMPATTSKNAETPPDSGVHLVNVDHLDSYRAVHAPQELRWDKRSRWASNGALNMGEVKGMSFDRVLIHPTGTITAAIENGAELAPATRAKYYVAITRARHSVGIVTEKSTTKSQLTFWTPPTTS